jgi:multidrug efflux pump subunit AcrB
MTWFYNLSMKYKLALVALLVAGIFVTLIWYGEKPETVTIMPQSQAETSQGVAKAADAANVPMSKPQQQEVAAKIDKVKEKPPDKIVRTTGENVAAETEKERNKAGADFAIVTDPKNPDEQPAVNPDDPVKLNVYNIKAYPKRFAEVSIGINGADVAYLRRVDIPKVPLLVPKGAVGYAGPFIRAEYGSGGVDAGLRLVVPF